MLQHFYRALLVNKAQDLGEAQGGLARRRWQCPTVAVQAPEEHSDL